MQDNFNEMIKNRGINIHEQTEQDLILEMEQKNLIDGSGVMNRQQRRRSILGVPLSGGDHSNKQRATNKKKEKNRAKKKNNKKR